MRALLTGLAAFTILASAWLFTMFLILRHPGFEWRAAMSLGFAAAGIVTIVAVRAARPPAPLLATAGVAALVLFATGTAVFIENNQPSAHFEGYAAVISLAFIAQGGLTLGWLASRPFRRTA